jgi:hypothetical protein
MPRRAHTPPRHPDEYQASAPFTPEEADQVRRLLVDDGRSMTATAKAMKRSVAMIRAFADAEGIDTVANALKRRTTAARAYAQTERLNTLNEAFEKVREAVERIRVDEVSQPRDIQSLMVALGILIDKRRLEEGEATTRTESVTKDLSRKIEATVDELAKRRTARNLSG